MSRNVSPAIAWIAGIGLLACGCAQDADPPAEAARPEPGDHHLAAGPDQPAGESTPADQAPPTAQPPTTTIGPIGAIEPADPVVPTAPPASPDSNPLRADDAPLPPAPPEPEPENPLRTFHSAQALRSAAQPAFRSTAPLGHGHRAIPRMAAPAGESTPPPAAADPPAAAGPEIAPEESVALEMAPLEMAPLEAVEPRETAPPRAAAPSGGGVRRQPLAAAGLGGLESLGSSAPPAALGAHDVVQVFYATDRAAVDGPAASLPEQAARFLPPAISVLVTLALGLVAVAKRRPHVWLLVLCGLVVSLTLGYQAGAGSLAAVRRGGHLGPQYTSDRNTAGPVQLGLCEVTIPKSHQVGELESPSILRLEISPDADKHVILQKTERLADEQFYELLAQRVAASPRKELFVFVHGFNVTFEDAARRTAQIHHDLGYEGAPIFFSWPAHDKFVLTYSADEANVSWSAAHLKQFLLDVTKNSNAQSINLIAHSMGNRALAGVLKELERELAGQSRLFNQVILAAPDIDADEFRHSIAPSLTRTANRITLYASARDEALAASQLVHRGPRAGDAGRGLVVIPGIDTIDVTPIDTSPWGHTYYGSSDPVLRDLGLLLTQSAPPSRRLWLAPAQLDGHPYWVFQPQLATAGLPGTPR
jgi:esterase/lipase superfamily enzyme